ncbi:MAG: FAD binding domain-containing protein [Anaerolineales bacterium]
MLGAFEIHEPATASEAADMLAHYGEEAAIYAGGTELLLIMKEGLVHYPHLVNIKAIPHLEGIRLEADGQRLRIGALVTHRQLEQTPLVREQAPLLSEAAAQVGNLRVRTTGTIGGNLCFAEPHSDPATLLLACGASLELSGVNGSRTVPVEEFFVGLFETAREPDEILKAITVPTQPVGAGSAYAKFGIHERPTATVAVILHLQDGVIDTARVALGSVGPTPVRVTVAEDILQGKQPGMELFAAAAASAREATDAVDDIYGSAAYKAHLAQVLTKRALERAAERVSGGARVH